MQSGAATTASSKIIKSIATSSTHSEIHALFHAVKDLMYTRRLLGELGYPQNKPSVVYEDNAACIKFAETLKIMPRTKHIEIKYLYVKQLVAWGQIIMVKIGTDDQVADFLTKVLDVYKHKRFSSIASGTPSDAKFQRIRAIFSRFNHFNF